LLFRLPIRTFLFLQRHRKALTLGVRAVIFDAENRVLLIRHSYTPGWHFPGGGVEPGETIATAMARELEEESGIALTGEAELFGLYLQRPHGGRDHVAVYVCRHWRQARQPQIPNMEIVDSRFFAPADLPADTTGPTRRRLAEIVEGASRAAEW
jgi:8-oxo-dGTP pyrophosphatase MutT (NUDIX family)